MWNLRKQEKLAKTHLIEACIYPGVKDVRATSHSQPHRMGAREVNDHFKVCDICWKTNKSPVFRLFHDFESEM